MPNNYQDSILPVASHDEYAQQRFLLTFKAFVEQELDPLDKELCTKMAVPTFEKVSGMPANRSQDVREIMEADPFHQFWLASLRTVQELMWDNVGESVDRQLDALTEEFETIKEPKGSLRIDSDFEVPAYIRAFDNHRMPGSYYSESRENDLRAGALFDRSAALYHVNRNGGVMNDGRAQTVIAHVLDRFSDFKPKRILDIGCTVGQGTFAYCDKFPEADVYAIDVGAPLLRYAHVRAEKAGKKIHFSLQNGEATDFADQSFDLVVSTAMLHETNRPAMARILKECHRLLEPGGIMAHLEVPVRYDDLGIWEQVRADWELHVNNEPFIGAIARIDFVEMMVQAGFDSESAVAGYQWQVPGYVPGKYGFEMQGGENGAIKMGSWYLASAQKSS